MEKQMTDLQFLIIKNSNDEIEMGMKYNFNPSIEFNGISATANTAGFTPLTSIARYYNWNSRLINEASNMCNERNEIAILNNFTPNLLLVPQTKGEAEDSFLISDLFKACSAAKITTLRFTHFGFIQNEIPKKEVEVILTYIKDNSLDNSLKTIIWDIDSRHQESLSELYKKIFGNDCLFVENAI